jgi:NADH dehydrogenase
VIVGGGFGGLYTALRLERTLGADPGVEVTLVSRDNYFLFTPMLHEIAGANLEVTHVVDPIRKHVRRVGFFQGEVLAIDVAARTVTVCHGPDTHPHTLPFDHLVVALGAVTNYFGMRDVEARACGMRTLADAITLRNRQIAQLEQADTECWAEDRERLLTFVVAGGGFAGVETAAAIRDFLDESLPFYRSLSEKHVKVVLIDAGEVILPELDPRLGRFAQRKLAERGIEIRSRTKVAGYDGTTVRLDDGSAIPAATLVWAAGNAPNPLLATLGPCPLVRGRLAVDQELRVQGVPGIWAVGDCAHIEDPRTGRPHPPTAQHALREARVVADNIGATIRGGRLRPFRFAGLGQLAAIGRRTGVANILGFRFSGFVAWWLWRSIYLWKLPRLERRIRVALDWTLDLAFSKDLVQLPAGPAVARSAPVVPAAADRRLSAAADS